MFNIISFLIFLINLSVWLRSNFFPIYPPIFRYDQFDFLIDIVPRDEKRCQQVNKFEKIIVL